VAVVKASRAQSAGQDGGAPPSRLPPTHHRYAPNAQNTSVADVSVDAGAGNAADGERDEDDEKARKVKRIAAKLHQARVAAYLIALAEQKKKEEEDRKRKEERQRKRAVLLSQRIQNEANERKWMGQEDKPLHQQAGGGAAGDVAPGRGGKGGGGGNGGDKGAPKAPRDAAKDILREATKDNAAATATAAAPAAAARKPKDVKDAAPAAAKQTAPAAAKVTERPKERVERPLLKDKAEAEGGKAPGPRVTAEAADAMVQRLSKVTPSPSLSPAPPPPPPPPPPPLPHSLTPH